MHHKLFVEPQGIYLLNHSVGRMPASTRDYVEQYFFSVWQHGSPDAWSGWMGALEKFKNALAVLFNGKATEFCPQLNISSAVSKTLAALPARESKKTILIAEEDFPSVGFSIQQATRLGYQIRFLRSNMDLQDPQTWSDALTADVHTTLVTHVHFNSSRLIPVAEITQICRERGITSIVDIAQSAGIVPIDLQQWQADIVVGSCVKWLCGGPGAGYIWIDADVVSQLQPIDVGWFSHSNPFEFDIHHFEYAEDSSRFWGGTPSVLPYVVATNSIQLIDSIGIENVRTHNQKLTQSIIDNVDPTFVVTPQLADQRGGTLVIKFPNQDKIERVLKEACVHFDARSRGIRLSPHIYNTDPEIAQVIVSLKSD